MDIDSFKSKFYTASPYKQLIYSNISVFVVISLLGVFAQLFGMPAHSLSIALQLPSSFGGFLSHFWSIFTYMFLHTGFWHLVFNMLCLYWFGAIFMKRFSSTQLIGVYIIGGLLGGLLYILSYENLPFFAGQTAILCGASASIMALIVASAMEMPQLPIRMLLIGEVKLWWLAVVAVLVSLFGITSDNAGGEISHIGGALAGLLWWWLLAKRNFDLTRPITLLINIFGNIFSKNRRKADRHNPYENYHYVKSDEEYNVERKQNDRKLDEILDKVRKSGYDSLTDKEKAELFDVSNKV